MDLLKSMGISGSGLSAQRTLMNTISMNLANVQTTRTEGGEPYRRRRAVFSHVPTDQGFSDVLLSKLDVVGHLIRTHQDHFPQSYFLPWETDQQNGSVRAEVIQDVGEHKMVYDPSHPDADANGYVLLPNINPIEEMVDLLAAVRSYEANVTAFNAAKSMALKSLEIGR
jgi:flagellar basal-body rod protein FlgC